MAGVPLLKLLYRVVTWATLAALVGTLLLILRKSPPPQVPHDPAAAARVEQKFTAASEALTNGQPAEVHLDRSELNSYLAQNLELEGSPQIAQTHDAIPDQQAAENVQSNVKDVKVDLDGDLVKGYIVFDFHGKDLSLELDGRLTARDGYVRFQPVSGSLGSLPLPHSTLDAAVERLMSSPENREKLRLPSDISDIRIEKSEVVIAYK